MESLSFEKKPHRQSIKNIGIFRREGGHQISISYSMYEGARDYRNSNVENFLHINFGLFQKYVDFRNISARFLQNQVKSFLKYLVIK